MHYLFDPLKKYFDFQGRASRKEYWMYQLLIFIALSVINIIGVLFMQSGYLATIIFIPAIIPSIALTVRRLHDINKPWTWIFISLVPLIGSIWFLVLLCTKGIDENNRYTNIDSTQI